MTIFTARLTSGFSLTALLTFCAHYSPNQATFKLREKSSLSTIPSYRRRPVSSGAGTFITSVENNYRRRTMIVEPPERFRYRPFILLPSRDKRKTPCSTTVSPLKSYRAQYAIPSTSFPSSLRALRGETSSGLEPSRRLCNTLVHNQRRKNPMHDTLDRVLDHLDPDPLTTGHGFTEGPVWHPDGYFLFTTDALRLPPRRGHRRIDRPPRQSRRIQRHDPRPRRPASSCATASTAA